MANYRKAPKLYHIGSKNIKDKKEPTFVIPQRIIQKIFSGIDGNKGNQIKLIMTLLGTIGDGSFAVTEAWITNVCGFSQPAYINARKALIKLGWVTLSKNIMTVNIENILAYDSHMDKVETYDGNTNTYDGRMDETYGGNMAEAYDPYMYNKEEQIINKEITIEEEPAQETNTDIKISRTGELEYILKRHNITEEDVKTIIRNNNIDDVTDFICFFHYMTKRDDCIASDSVPEIKNILSAYFECNKMTDIRSGYELHKEDIIEYASDEQKNIFTTSSFFHQFSSSATLDDRRVESLRGLLSRGARLGTSFFKRNLGRPVAG